METIPINFIIKDSPTAVAILDTEMRFMSHSDVWKNEYASQSDSIIGKSYYDILPETPESLRTAYDECLKGASSHSKGEKFTAPNGAVQWLTWKINNWKDDHGHIGGLIVTLEDVTVAKRREELLLKAEHVARIGGWEVDMATSKVFWTDVTKEIHEVPMDYEPNLEEGINFYKAGQHREEITHLVSEAIKDGTPWDTDLVIVTANGNELWVRAKGETEMIDGKCTRIFGTFQDIDEKKKIALNYKQVTDKLTAASLGANFGVFNFDIVNNVLDWDESMYRIYGVDKKDFSGEYEAWRSGLHPDDIERCDGEVAMAISGEKDFDSEFRIIWPNGKIRHIRGIIVIQRDLDGKALKMTGTNWDVTELKITQGKLKKSRESFQAAFENSHIGMALVGLNGQLMKVNQSLCDSLGYNEAELTEMTIDQITHKEDLNKSQILMQKLKDGNMESYQTEKRYYHKNGRVVHTILAVTGVKNTNGNLSHTIGQVLDISPRINAEKKLTRLVDVTTEQNESLLNFAHIVSHNLRSHSSNLSMLSGFLDAEKNEDERQNLLGMLSDASKSLSETVMHLNEVVQVKVGASEKMKSVNLFDTLKNVKKNLSLLIKEKKASCHIDIPKNLEVEAIPAYLDSILLNLFTNSIKYSSPDRSPVIRITAEQNGDKTILTFSDNGLGIDLDRHGEKLFGMYKTFHRNKDAKGIGLFITKNQIEAMNGKIEVQSTVDVGTTFTLYFESGLTRPTHLNFPL
ncbi:MAG: PAS domain S-box protein [Pricia sp.]